MTNKRFYLWIIFLCFFILGQENAVTAEATSKYQLGEILVSASKTEEYTVETGSSAIVITKEEIAKKKYKTVLDAVRNEKGISTASNGVFGGATSVYIRGAESGHTLVLMDGVRLYDPISTNASYDLANLTLDNVERIEIIKGPQSSLYGSDAMAGVINIITKKGKGKSKISASAEVASKSTYTESLGVSGSTDKFHYSLETSRQDSKGISQARDGVENDAYKRTTVNSKFSYNVSDDLEVGVQSLYLRAKYDLDDGTYQDDPNYWMKYENALVTFFGNQRINDIWNHSLQYSWLKNTRQYFDDEDSIDVGEYYRAWFKGWTQEANWQHNIDIKELFSFDDNVDDMIVTGYQYNYEAGQQKSTFGDLAKVTSTNQGFFLENKFGFDKKLFNTLALRMDDHSRFGVHTTGRGTLSYLFDTQTRFKGSYGTGFNAPSLYQLFSDYGDANLKAEESWGYDCGLEQELFEGKISLGAVYFHNRFKNLIEYDSLKTNAKSPWGVGQYVNRGSAKTEGIETDIQYHPLNNLSLKYSFTYTNAMDLQNKYHLIRRPNNKHNLSINIKFLENFNLNFDITHNVKIYESFVFGQTPERLKDYTVSNLSLSYNANDHIEIFAKVENLFDKTYQEVNGYSNKPRFFHLGIKTQF